MSHTDVQAFFDENTWTVSYLVADPVSTDALIIDPVLDYDALASQTSTESVERLIAEVERRGLRVRAVLETHAHADHLTGAQYLSRYFGVPTAIGRDITRVQETFAHVFGWAGEVATNGSQFDQLLEGGHSYHFGTLKVEALSTPGHTPACLSYLIGDAVFTGDALFMEDYGTGRTDFPAGSAEELYKSVHEVLYALPNETRVFVGHDYQPGGRPVRWETTIGAQKAGNVQLSASTSQREFVSFRKSRDAGLRPPRLIYPSVQVNVFGGNLPPEQDNGIRYLRTPLNMRSRTDDVGRPRAMGESELTKPAAE